MGSFRSWIVSWQNTLQTMHFSRKIQPTSIQIFFSAKSVEELWREEQIRPNKLTWEDDLPHTRPNLTQSSCWFLLSLKWCQCLSEDIRHKSHSQKSKLPVGSSPKCIHTSTKLMLYNNQYIITITLAVYLQVHIINGWSRAKNSTYLKKTWYFS